MTTIDIERRLREAAPDEPAILPALVLPHVTATGGLRDRSLDTPLGFGRWSLTMRVAIAALLLTGALVGALVSGAIRLDRLNAPFAQDGVYEGKGIALSYPGSWQRITPAWPIDDGSSVALIVSSADVDGCSADQVGTLTPAPASVGSDGVHYLADQHGLIFSLGDRIYACVIERPMAPGEVRVVVSQGEPQRIQIGPFGDFEEAFIDPPADAGAFFIPGPENGFTEEVGGMPARLVVRDHSAIPGADEVRAWVVASPEAPGSLWMVVAALRGPDLEALRADADAMARSLAFTSPPPQLTEGDRDAALAKVIDGADRQARQYPGTRLYGCFPRTPGSATVTITEGRDGPLREPATVTCTTTVEPTALRHWRATLVVEWPATDGVPAGRWGQELVFDANGEGGGGGSLFPDGWDVVFPGSWSASTPPQPLPELPPGTLVRVIARNLQAGYLNLPIESGGPSERMLDQANGSLMTIVEGPVRDDGLDWYLADNGGELGWFVPTAAGAPLIEVAEPTCPTASEPTVEDLVYLSTLERRLCAGDRELTFGPSQYARRENFEGDPWTGVPAWLATEPPFWALFGSGGAKGLDAGLPAVLAPGVERPAPGDWITVRGHFNDPASATCSWAYPDTWSDERASAQVQHRRCAERFVITSIEPADAP